ncbi:hypothetical protein [Actinomycetospora chibensis]|uniref:Uncharacterized protein n=1 Tax=Actinomycetospora chibensis TaxID=663606 RepID=A0ABV9RMS8_9PSEU|nr:hypothetical protein [Actinomycetospora chibensis]MDD7923043.1 hypothetical protein [Actinomycetospora chibensis]
MTAADTTRSEALWQGLNPNQAGGSECVMCERSFTWPALPDPYRPEPIPGTRTGPAGIPAVPVGCSETGSQVFACAGICAALAWPD